VYGVAGSSQPFLSKAHNTSTQTDCPWYPRRVASINSHLPAKAGLSLPARQRRLVSPTFAKAGDLHAPSALAAWPHRPPEGRSGSTPDFLCAAASRCPLCDSALGLFAHPVGGSSQTAATTAREATPGKGWQPACGSLAVGDFASERSDSGRSLPAPIYSLLCLPSNCAKAPLRLPLVISVSAVSPALVGGNRGSSRAHPGCRRPLGSFTTPSPGSWAMTSSQPQFLRKSRNYLIWHQDHVEP